MALKNALLWIFPEKQQQLCVYHVNANIRTKIISRWKKSADELDALIGPKGSDEVYLA